MQAAIECTILSEFESEKKNIWPIQIYKNQLDPETVVTSQVWQPQTNAPTASRRQTFESNGQSRRRSIW